MKNEDNRCFGYSIIASRVHLKGSRNTATAYYKYFKNLGLDKIHFPVEPNQVPPIEDTMKTNISVFSFYDDEGKARFPLDVSEGSRTGTPTSSTCRDT